jgi:tRNA-uridine 2-sulfurtransferase
MRVFVAMSGGVDSSVAAALLCEAGHDVTGVTMQIWPPGDDEGGCCSVSAVRDARRVCDLLGIPHYVLNFRDSFERTVIEDFVAEYAAGRTPNPCIVCNDIVKFGDLLHRVQLQGAEALATGHYARIVERKSGEPALCRGVDPAKDQSYFLYRLTAEQMSAVLFPVGELTKPQVRAHASRLGLAIAEKPDSQEVCFAKPGEHAVVVGSRRPSVLTAGEIVDRSGQVLGEHRGLANYTVGQRHGLGLGGGEARYVIALSAQGNRVVVGPRDALQVRHLEASSVVWHAEPSARVNAMVRYRMAPVAASAHHEGDALTVEFDTPIEGVAPGQAVVCYDEDRVVGGGVIECAT